MYISQCNFTKLFTVLIIGFLLWWKCRRTEDVLLEDEKEDYEVRENVMDYDEEGAGQLINKLVFAKIGSKGRSVG